MYIVWVFSVASKTCFPSSTKSTSTPLLGQALEEVDFLKETHVLLEASTGRQQSSPLRGYKRASPYDLHRLPKPCQGDKMGYAFGNGRLRLATSIICEDPGPWTPGQRESPTKIYIWHWYSKEMFRLIHDSMTKGCVLIFGRKFSKKSL